MSDRSSTTPAPASSVPTPEPGGTWARGPEFAATGLGRDRIPLVLLITLAVLNAAAPLSTDMYLSSLPQMAVALDTDAASVQLTLTTFMLGIAAGQLVLGPLSDRWGRRRPLLIAVVVFLVAGVLCALAPSVGTLIALRFVAGFSGSAGMVIGRAVVSDSVRGVAAARAFSLLMTVGALAPVIAPLSGTAIDSVLGWRAIFWVLAAAAAVMLVATLLTVEETLPWHRRTGGGLGESLRLGRTVLRNRRYVGYLLTLVFAFGALFGYISASPFVVQEVLGLSAGQYAADFAVNSAGLILGGALGARLVGRVSAGRLLGCGVALIAFSSVGLLVLGLLGVVHPWSVLPLFFLVTAAMGLIFGNGTGLAMETVVVGAGTASALIGALQFGLGALVSPLVGLGGQFTMVPMGIVMTACAAVSTLSLLAVTRSPRAVPSTTR